MQSATSSISKAIVLVSGGLDSLVSLAIANQDFQLFLLHINYGQLTFQRELTAFHNIGDFYNIDQRMVCDLPSLKQIGGSSLTDPGIPVSKANLNSSEIPSSYVPFRNAHFLSIAVSWSEVTGASSIFIGAVTEDSSGYPDCRREFYDDFEKAILSGSKPETDIRIITPVIRMKKKDIILKGFELNAPLHLTWSCYQNSEKACGICDSCALRLRAFKQAGIKDPIEYISIP